MKLKEKYYDRINKTEIEVNVNAKVAHFLQKEREKNRILSPDEVAKLSKKKQEEYYQRSFERKQESLDQLMYDGFQPSEEDTIEDELCRRYRERKYLASISSGLSSIHFLKYPIAFRGSFKNKHKFARL